MSYYHEEERFGPLPYALIGVAAVPVLVLATAAFGRDSGISGGILFALAILALVLVLFAAAKLVIDVDDKAIHASFHYLWPTQHIALDDVARAHATRYDPVLEYGGWGVRLGPRGWAFNTGGREGVLVETKSGARIMLGSHHAKELEAAIAKAVAARG